MKTQRNPDGGRRETNQPARNARFFVAYPIAAIVFAGVTFAVPVRAQSANTLPTGGQITSGAGSISQSGTQLTVTQNTDHMIAQWGTFNIGQNASVQFNQPGSSSVALNRIQDQNPSQILGSLSANGQVFLINPSGLYFGKNATVNVGSLVASSLDIADADFQAGKYNLAGRTGSVVNDGAITAVKGGIVALISPVVANDGTITAQGGVALAAGSKVNLNFGGDGLINLTVNEAAVDAQVSNKGLIKSVGGMVIMTARAADELVDAVVNNSGIIEANTLSNVNGRIILDGGDLGVVENTGTLSATGANAGETGGTVVMTGNKVGLFDAAVVDVSGQAGGGTISIGGGFQGKDSSIQNSAKTYVGPDAVLKANAGTIGNGGQVVVWSNDSTQYFGTLEAKGGSTSGNGGSVEVSSKHFLDYNGRVNLAAPFGSAGSLLLDPQNIIIATAGGAVLDGSNMLAFATNAGNPSTIDPSAITTVLNKGVGYTVTLQATDDITVNNAIITSGSAGGTLTLQAGRSIFLNSDIHSANGDVNFTVNDSTASGSRTAGAAVFTNTASHVDAGTGTISLTMGTNSTVGATSGDITTGHMTANNLTVTYSGATMGTSVDLGQSDIASNLTVTSGGRNITNTSGTLIVRGTATINAGTTGNVTFTNANTDFNILGVTANAATINDTNAMQIGTTVTQGNYTLVTKGPMASYSTQTMTVGGMASFTASNGGFGYADPYVNLPNNNDFQGGITISASSTGQSGTGGWAYIKDTNALAVGNLTLGSYLTIVTGGAITQNGGTTITVPTYTSLTAGNGTTQYDITLDGTNNDFGSSNGSGSGSYSTDLYQTTIPYAKNVTLVDKNSFEFGTSNITGNLNLTAGGDIFQYYYRYYNYAPITVQGTTTFVANNASSPINLYLGSDDPFYTGYPGSANTFTGTVTLSRNNVNTGFTNVQLRNTSSSASVLAGLTSVGTLNNVYLTYNSAPAVTLPGMTLTGSLKVYAPSVANTASTPGNTISQTGSIIVAGDTLVQAASTGDINLTDPANNFSRIDVIGARDAAITDSNAVVLYGSQSPTTGGYYLFNISRNLTVVAGGAISDSSASDNNAYINVTGGTASFNAGSGNNVTLDNYYNQWNTVAFPAANNVQLGAYYTNIILDTSTISGTLSLYGNGNNLSQVSGHNVTAAGNTTFSAFSTINLPSTGNRFGALAIDYDTGSATICEDDPITQNGAWSTSSKRYYLTTTNGQAITLTQASNQFASLTLTQSGSDVGAGAVNVTTSYQLNQNGAWTTHGTTTLNVTGGYSVVLQNQNNVFGPLQVTCSGSTYLYGKDWTDTGSTFHPAITDVGSTGAWTTSSGSLTDLRAYNSTAVSTTGTINLANTSNALGDLTLFGGPVTITENHAITDYGSGAGYTGWSTTGTTTLNSVGNIISLDNYNNVIGPIAITGTSAGTHPSSVYITDSNNIDQASAWTIGTAAVTLDARTSAINLTQANNVLGAVTILTTPASNVVPSSVSITEDDAITQGNTWQLKPNTGTTSPVNLVTTSGQAITLSGYDNLLGNLKITQNGAGTGAVSIREIDSAGITQAASGGEWLTRGTTTLDSGANPIALSNTNNVLGAIAIVGTSAGTHPSTVTLSENDDITQASAWKIGTATVTLDSQMHAIVLDQIDNELGNIYITTVPASDIVPSSVTIKENDDITQGSAWNLKPTSGTTSPVTLLTKADQAITLGSFDNYLGDLIVTQSGPNSAPSAVSIRDIDSAGITQAGAWTTHGVTTLNAGTGNPIVLTQANNVLANIAITGAPSSVSITENDAITQNSVWSLGTAPVALVTTNAQAITLGGLDNILGNLTVTQNGSGSGAVSIREKDTTNGITQGAAAWFTQGTTTIDASGYGISLANKDNVFGPLQLIGGTATSTSITLYAKQTAGHDAITDVGAAGAWSAGPTTLYAYATDGTTVGGGNIILTNASNSLGDLTLKGATVTITENGTITDGAAGWQTSGVTTFNPGANAVLLDSASNVLGAIAVNSATTAVTITEADNITQASAWSLPSAPITLTATGYNILLTQAANQLGDLKLTAQNATVVENHAITDASAWTVPGTTTLTAGTNAIVLDANPRSDFGTVSIVSASNADIADVNGIIFDTTNVTGTLNVTAGGAITQTANAIKASTLVLSGTGGSATLNTATNNVATLSATFTSGGGLSYTDADNVQLTAATVGANAINLVSVAGTYTGLNTLSSSTSSLTVNTGTALTVPALNIAGAQSYTAGGLGITVDGNVNSTAAGAISFNSPVILNRDVIVSSTNSPITFYSTVAGGTNDLGVNAGNSSITFKGAVSNLGDSATSNAALSVTATTGSTVFESTLSSNNGLLVSGPSTFQDTVTLGNGGIGSTFTGEVTLGKVGGMNLSGYKYMDFNSGILMANGPATILTNSFPLRFNGGTVHGPYGLTLNAGTGETATVTGLSHIGSDLTSLDVTGYSLNFPLGGISIAGPQTYTAVSGTSITLNGAVTGTSAGAILFNSPVVLNADSVISSANSAITFMSTVDGAHDLTLSSGSGIKTFTGKVGSSSAVGDGVGASITLQGAGATSFGDTVATRSGIVAAGPVTFSGNVTLANGDTGSTFNGLVTTGAVTLNGYDGLAFNAGLTLTGNTVLVSNGSNTSFGGTVSGAYTLSVNALSGGAGTVTGLANISTNLTGLTVTGQTLSLPAGTLAVAGPMSFTAAGGITLNGNVGSLSSPTTGQIDFTGPVSLAADAVVTAANAPINFSSTVNGTHVLVVDAGTGTTTFSGAVGGTAHLASLTASGTAAINGGIVTTDGAQLYNNAVTLGANTTLTGTALTFGGTLNGGYTLLANVSGTTTFGGIVGGTTALTSITTDAAGTVALNSTAVTTTGSQVYNEAISLGANTILTGTGLRLLGGIDGAHSLTIADSGATTLGAAGTSTPLSSVNVTGLTISAGPVTTTGSQSYSGALTINGSLAGSGLAFNNTVQLAANNLTLDAGTGTLAFANTLTAGTNNLTLTGDEINFANAVTGTGNFTLQPSSPSVNVVVGGSASTGALDLTATELGWLPSTLASLTLGRATGTGTLALAGATNFGTIPLTLNGLGGISQSGALTSGAITLNSNGSIDLSTTSNSLGAIAISGTPTSLSLSDSTPLTQSAAWVLGTAPVTLNAGSNAITLTQNNNTFGDLALTGGTVQINENADTTLATSNVGALTVNSTGAISTTGTVAVTGAATFRTLNDAGKSVTLDHSSTFGSLYVFTRNAADTADVAGGIALSPAASTTLKTLQTLGNIAITAPLGSTISQDGSSVISSAGLELLGTGNYDLSSGTNTITTLAGNTGNVSFSSASGYAIGTVNTAGLTSSGTVTLSTGGTVTQSQPLVAGGLCLLGTGSTYTLSGAGNDVTTLAGSVGTVSFRDDTGFTLGTVGATNGLTATGNVTFSTLGTINQSQPLVSSGLELLGAGSTYTLNNSGNNISILAGNVGTVWIIDNTGFTVGSVNTTGLTASTSAVFSTTASVGQTTDITAAKLGLLGAGGTFTLTRNSNSIGIFAADTGSLNLHNNGSLVIGQVNPTGIITTGDVTIVSNGAVTQTEALTIGGNLSLTTTHNAGDVTIDNSGATATVTGDSLVGGNYVLTATGQNVTQAPSTNLQVAGNLTINSSSATLDGAANLIAGTTSLPGTNSTVRQSGVITLGDLNITGNYTVISTATNRSFSSGAITGTAVDLSNSANHVTGTISVTTVAPSISSGAPQQTGINQTAGTSVKITGNASFTAEPSVAGSLGVVLTNTGNTFGSVRASGNLIDILDSSTASVIAGLNGTTSTNFAATGSITQTGAIITPTLSVTSGGSATLTSTNNQVSTVTLDGVGGSIAYTDTDSFAIAALNAHGNSVALTAGGTGAITQSGAIQNVGTLTVTSGGATTLDNASNTVGALGAITSGGALYVRDSAGGLSISSAVQAATGDVTIRTSGDLTLGASSVVTATNGNIYVSTEGAGNFINNAGTGVFTVGSGDRWLVYSKTPDLVAGAHTVKDGLTSSFRLYGTTFTSKAPGGVTQTGDGFIYADSPSSSLTISATVTGTASHTYGDSPTATLGYTISGGLADSEDSTANIDITGTAIFDLTGSTTYHTLSSGMNADNYSITFTGGLASSYTLVPDTNGVSYTVNKAALTYNATTASRIYGDANPTFTGTVTGFKLSQGVADLGGAVSWTTLADTTSNVGSYAITGGGYTSGNYSFSQAAGNATALSVTARPITLTADNLSRIYGNANPANGTYTVTSGNLVNSDLLASTVSVSSPATLTSNVNNYTLTPSSASFTAGSASNYTITYADGSLAVTTRPITLTATNQSRYYGNANPTTGGYTISSGSLANTDALNASVSVSSPATLTDNVGSFSLTPGSASFTTGLASNYAVSYADGSLAVTARPITITASNQSRTYGDANPLTGSYIVGGSGLANTDALDATVAVSSPATLTSHVNSYALTPSGAGFSSGLASNYAITYADGSLAVTTRPLTLTADDQSRSYGNANPTTGTYAITSGNLVNGDSLVATLAVSSPALPTSNVGGYALNPSGAVFSAGAASDYAVGYAPGSLTITARPITLTANDQSRYYGNANPTTGTFTISSGNLANSDALNANLAVTSPATLADHVGSFSLTPSAVTFTTGSSSNYAVSYADGSLAVTARPITLTAINQNRTYGDANPTSGTYTIGGSGLGNSDTLASLLAVTSPAVATSNVGGYTLTPSGAVFANGLVSDYAITYADGSLAVTARPITVTPNDLSRIYGDANPASGTYLVTTGNLVNSDALASNVSVSSPATLTSHVNNYALNSGAVSFTSGLASNYAIAYSPGTLSVTPRPITLTATNQNRVYGDANPTSGAYTVGGNGLANTDTLNPSLTVSSPASATSDVGSYALTPSNVLFTSGAATDYAVSYADGSLTLTTRPITVTLDNQSRIYGDANPTSGTFAVSGSGLVNTDALNSNVAVSSLALLTSNVGNYALNSGSVAFTSGSASNYAISYVNATLGVTARPITITPTNLSRIYGDANPTNGSFTISTGSLANTDTLTSSVAVASPATSASNVGSYTLTPSSAAFSSGTSSNYAITYANGSLAVTPAALTFTADPTTRMYGDINPTFTGSIAGFKNSETLATATTGTMVFTSPAGITANAGSQAINGSGITANNGNYIFSQAAGNATALTITPRPLTVTAVDFNRFYGDANPATMAVTSSGLVNGDTIANAGASTSATQASNVGNYSVTPSGTSFSSGLASNYSINYISGFLTITPRPLSITPVTQGRVYGEANPLYGAVTASNLANGDTLGVSSLTSSAAPLSDVGSYNLLAGSAAFTQGSSSNYSIVYAPGSLTITPRPITVTANTQTKVYGAADPTLTYQTDGQSTGRGLLTGQTLSGSLTRTSGETVAGGPYAISIGSLASNTNYTISFVGSSLAITPATLTYVATSATANSSASIPDLLGNVTGFQRGDTLSTATSGNVLWTTSAGPSSGPGTYAINGSGLTANSGNYVFEQSAGNPSALTIIAGTSSLPRPVIPGFAPTSSGLPSGESLLASTSTGVASSFGPGTESILSGLVENVPTSFFISDPAEVGSLTLYGAQLPGSDAFSSGLASFTSERSTAIMLMPLIPSEATGSVRPPTSSKISAYLNTGKHELLVGTFSIHEESNFLSATPIEDLPDARIVSTAAVRKAIFTLKTTSSSPVEIEVSLSDDGLLLVKVPAAFIEERGVKCAILAGVMAARQGLQAEIGSIRVVRIILPR